MCLWTKPKERKRQEDFVYFFLFFRSYGATFILRSGWRGQSGSATRAPRVRVRLPEFAGVANPANAGITTTPSLFLSPLSPATQSHPLPPCLRMCICWKFFPVAAYPWIYKSKRCTLRAHLVDGEFSRDFYEISACAPGRHMASVIFVQLVLFQTIPSFPPPFLPFAPARSAAVLGLNFCTYEFPSSIAVLVLAR